MVRRVTGSACGGFTYIWMLFAVALLGILLAAAGQVWRTEALREKEKELLFVGEQFRQAIGSYYENSPGVPRRYPESLEKLLADDRFPLVKRHLRKMYPDPMTGSAEWGLVRQPGVGITGVYSLSTRQPIKRANFAEQHISFAGATSYKDWKFVYFPGSLAATMTAPPPVQPQPAQPPQPPAQPQPPATAQPPVPPNPPLDDDDDDVP